MSGHSTKRRILARVSGKGKVFHPLYPVLILGFLLFPLLTAFGEDWHEQGMHYLKSKQYEDAVKAFSKAIEIDPGKADAYYHRGSSWFQLGAFDQAIADFSSVLNIDPDNVVAYVNRGTTLFKKGDYDRAIDDYNDALDIDPRNANAYNEFAWLLATCPDDTYRDGDRAVVFAKKAVELKPGVPTLDTLAAAYAEAGKFSDAIEAQLGVISLKNKEGNPGDLGKYIERLKSYSSHRVLGENGPVPEGTKSQQPGVKRIEVSVANIRSRPSTSASIVAKLRAGEEVTILRRDNDWYTVQLPRKRLGWAHQTLFLKTE